MENDIEIKSCENVQGESFSYGEAVELTGHGWYNRLVLVACSLISHAVALDMFGFGIVVAAATCDLELELTEAGLLVSAPFIGIIFAFPWGYYTDTRGRRRALLLSTIVGFIFASLTSFATSWQVMLVLKIIGTSFSVASFTLTMTYLSECVGSQRSGHYLFVMNGINLASEFVSFALAYLLLPLDFRIPMTWLSITFRPWRLFNFVLAVPLGLGALMMLFLKESSKFLVNRGQIEEALKVLKIIHKVNNGNREEYPVKQLRMDNTKLENCCQNQSFWTSIIKQTLPLFQPPLLWTTFQLFYLITICCSTCNIFLMWYPKMVNMFFNTLSENVSYNDGFSMCQAINTNESNPSHKEKIPCDDTLSMNTFYSGMLYGLFFSVLTIAVGRLAAHRRIVLIATFIISAICGSLVNILRHPIGNMIVFTLFQGTSIGIGCVASYFSDLYPTSYRGMVASLGVMVARLVSFGGVNLVGAVITNYCEATFYGWSIFVLSGVAVTLFLKK